MKKNLFLILILSISLITGCTAKDKTPKVQESSTPTTQEENKTDDNKTEETPTTENTKPNNNQTSQGNKSNKKATTQSTFIMLKNKSENLCDLYAKYPDKDVQLISTNVSKHEEIGYLKKSKSILALDADYSLIRHYKNGYSKVIAKGPLKDSIFYSHAGFSYMVSEDEKVILYIPDDNCLYMKKGNNAAVKIGDNVVNFNMNETGTNIVYKDEATDLYLYKNGKKEKISTNVMKFFVINESVYYGDYNGMLYLYKNGKTTPISQDAYDDALSKLEEATPYNLYEKNGTLYLGEKKVADKVVNYASNLNEIAYITKDNKLYVYNIKTGDKVLVLQNTAKYSTIYFEDKLLLF